MGAREEERGDGAPLPPSTALFPLTSAGSAGSLGLWVLRGALLWPGRALDCGVMAATSCLGLSTSTTVYTRVGKL